MQRFFAYPVFDVSVKGNHGMAAPVDKCDDAADVKSSFGNHLPMLLNSG